MRVSGCLTIAAAFLVNGCANLNSIHRTHLVDSSDSATVVTVDGKQRHLLVTPEFDETKSNRFRICAEAAPDVFSAYASSLGAKLGLGATERNAEFANSIAESAATIERTQTINMLRESMYRTCERYLSGALTDGQFIIQAARDQQSMVRVLAIEQLTGAIRAKPTIISGPATSASIIDGTEAARLIERFRAEEDTAKANLSATDKAYTSAQKTGKCDTVAEKPGADAKDPTADEWTACKSAETLLAQRKEELKAATSRLDKALTLAADFVSNSSASTTSGTNDGAAYTATRPGDAALIAVAAAIENIATSPGIDEPLMFCIAYIQSTAKLNDTAVDACAEIIVARAKVDVAREQNRLGIVNAAGYRRAVVQGNKLNTFMRTLFARIESSAPDALAKKMAAFEKMAGTDHGLGADCTSIAACKRAVSDSDLSESYLAEGSKLDAALASWDKL